MAAQAYIYIYEYLHQYRYICVNTDIEHLMLLGRAVYACEQLSSMLARLYVDTTINTDICRAVYLGEQLSSRLARLQYKAVEYAYARFKVPDVC